MKRAVPQDANSVSFSAIDGDSAEEHSRQPLPEANRRVRTSAAMLGLALSVGAYGLVAPQQGDAAIAAEPTDSVTSEPNSTAASVEVASAAESAAAISSASQSPRTAHAVQEGQTLWKIAELYGVDVAKLATMNRLRPNAVLFVGQVLQIPVVGQSLAGAGGGGSAKAVPDLRAVPTVPAEPTALGILAPESTAQNVQDLLKAQQQTALQGLKQNRNRLKQSLAELKSEESEEKAQVVASVPQPEAVALMNAVTSANFVSYQVNPGDTLSSIAQSHGVPANELAKLNQLNNPNFVKVNQQIKVPQATVAPQSAAPAPTAPSIVSSSKASPVSVPVVPSLAATQTPMNPTLPVGIGGDAQQFAFTNSSASKASASSQTSDARQRDNSLYLNNLVSEIVRLREKYQGARSGDRASRSMSAAANPSPGVSQTVNQAASLFPRQNQSKPKNRLLATSGAGSETYAPLLRPPVGKVVAPNQPLIQPDSNFPGSNGSSNVYIWPAKGMLTSGYGWRWGRMHKGIDIAAPVGTPVVAAASGKVVSAGWNDGGYGNLVEIKHSDGSTTRYAHNSRLIVKAGQEVQQGQQIAAMGSTGFSTGPHSHFEVHLKGRGAVNPIAYLPQSRS